MQEKTFYELNRMMQDHTAVKKDMNDAAMLVKNLFQDRYLGKMQRAFHNQQHRVQESPPSEIRLLHAMKPFVAADKHPSIDRMIDTMMMISTVRNISNEMNPSPMRSTENGSWDGDHIFPPQQGKMIGLMMLMMLMG